MKESQQIEWKETWRGVYADRLKIWNPGELPERWTVGKLVGPHSSRPYNPNVANAFFRAGEIEAWGRGIQRIYDACREAGTPPPKIQYEPGDLWIEFPFSPAYLAVVTSPVPRGDGLGDGLGDDAQSRLLRIIRARPASSITELARQLKISTTAVEKTIKRLKAKGVGNALVQPRAGIGKFSSEQKGRPCLNNPAPNAKRRTGSPPCSRTRPGPIASATATSASGTSRRTTAPSSRP